MVRNSAFIVAISTLFTGFEILVISSSPGIAHQHNIVISQNVQKPLPPESSATKRPTQPIEFGLVDGTPVKLKFKQGHLEKSKNGCLNLRMSS